MNITLNNNIDIKISSLYQKHTYAGQFCGNLKTINDDIINSIEFYTPDFLSKIPLYLISIDKYKEKLEEKLPSIMCYAKLIADINIRDIDANGSMLLVVWFQDDFFKPLSDEILDEIQKIPWQLKAMDYEW